MTGITPTEQKTVNRWRMVLGQHAEASLGSCLSDDQARLDDALEMVYRRALKNRADAEANTGSSGSLDPTALYVPGWLETLRELLPAQVFQEVQGHAFTHFGMTEILSDPDALLQLEPNLDLAMTLLSFRGNQNPAIADQVREIIARVVEEITRTLTFQVERAFSGGLNRFSRTTLRSAANFDARKTIEANLHTYDPDRRCIIPRDLHFCARQRRHLPWTVILCVDQSGSMLGSLIHATIMAGILAAMPSVRTHFVVFDTAVVDLSDRIDDPVELLFSVQMGGGTNIGQAMRYCETLVTDPKRTVIALISDFMEGANPRLLPQIVHRLSEARVTQIGLVALSDRGAPVFDRSMAERLASCGMNVAAMTPDVFAKWLAKVMA